MKKTKTQSSQREKMRDRTGKERLGKALNPGNIPSEDIPHLLHEIQVQQVELEKQNAELRRRQLQLEADRDKYFDLYDAAPLGYFTLDQKGMIIEVNLSGANLLGVERQHLIREKFSRFISPEFQDSFCFYRQRLLETQTRQTCELKLLKKDGTSFFGLLESIAVEDADGNFSRIRTAITDISDCKQFEDRLNEAEAKYHTLVENAAEGIVVTQDGFIKFFNSTLTRLSGYPGGELTARPFVDFIHPEDRERVMDIHIRRLEGERVPPRYAFRVFTKNKNVLWLENNAVLITWDGRPATLNFLADITERKRMEDALRESEEKYRLLFENESDAVMIFDADTRQLEDANRAALALYGYTTEEFLNLKVEDISAEKEKTKATVQKVKDGKSGSNRVPVRYFMKKDGTVFPGEIYTGKFVSGGRPKIIGAVRDITEHIQVEKTLLKQAHELSERVKEIRCLYEISQLMEKPGISLVDIIQGIVDLVPRAWQYPEITCARAVINDQIYTTRNFRQTALKQSRTIAVNGHAMGTLEIFYLEEKPERDEGPFLKEEKILLKMIAERIGKTIENKQAEEALTESEQRYRGLSEATFEAIFISEKGVCLDANKRAAELFGYDEAELIGIFGTDVIAPESKELVKRNMLSGYEKPYEAIAQKKDGAKFHVEIRGKMMKYKDKNVRITVLRDISEQKRAEKALRESEKRYRNLFNSIPIGLYRTSQEGQILDVNPAMLEILGYPERDSLLQTPSLVTYVDPEDRRRLQRLLEETDYVRDFNVQLRRHDGKIIWTTISARIVHDTDSQMTYYEGAMADISDRKRAEEHIRNLTQQLMKAQEDERQMISRELHDRVAQDLSTLKIAGETLFDHQPAVTSKTRQRVSEFSGILDRTILAVRDLAYDLRPPGLDDMGFVQALSMYCEDFSKNSGVEVDFSVAGIVNLRLDSNIEINIYRLVQEGLNNIRKHAHAARAIVKLVGSFPNVILRIEDDGKGFDMAQRELMLNFSKRMGLRSMRERVNLLQGQMTIHAQPGKGTKILIKFPYQVITNGTKEDHPDRR